jgi:hypothetical protein
MAEVSFMKIKALSVTSQQLALSFLLVVRSSHSGLSAKTPILYTIYSSIFLYLLRRDSFLFFLYIERHFLCLFDHLVLSFVTAKRRTQSLYFKKSE